MQVGVASENRRQRVKLYAFAKEFMGGAPHMYACIQISMCGQITSTIKAYR